MTESKRSSNLVCNNIRARFEVVERDTIYNRVEAM
jgi:hypothetical protein